jgi:LacI family transcriptional regulator
VWKVIEESEYRPNIQACAPVSGRSHILGLVVSEITNPFFPEIVQAFENMGVEQGYEILLVSTVYDPERMDLSVRRMTGRRVDFIAVMTFGMEDLLLEDWELSNAPLVFGDVGPKRPRVSNIRINYLNGIRQAVQHLAALRHEQIAFISGPLALK